MSTPNQSDRHTASSSTSTDSSGGSNLSITTCEKNCDDELHSLTHELEKECDQSVTKAVSEERRSSEPIIAGLKAERDRWKQDAEDAVRAADLWQDVAIGTGIVAVVVLLVGVVL